MATQKVQNTYSQRVKRLEEIVAALENGETEFEDGLALYQEGLELTKTCLGELQANQGKITILKRELSKLSEKPFTPKDDEE